MGEFPSWVYIVLLGAAAIVYSFLLPKKKNNKKDEVVVSSAVEKVEDTLEHYMTEIERENEEIIDLVAQIKQESTAKQIALQEQVSEMRQRLMELEQRAAVPAQPQTIIMQQPVPLATESSSAEISGFGQQGEALRESAERMRKEQEIQLQTEEVISEQERIQDRYPELFKLHESGKSVDTIAKTIGLQRGEVLLILQLAKQEGQS